MKLNEILKMAYRLDIGILLSVLCVIFTSFPAAQAMVLTCNNTHGTESVAQAFPEKESARDSLYRAVYGYGPDSTSVRILGNNTVMRKADIPILVRKYAEEMTIIVDNMNMSYEEFSQILPEDLFYITIGNYFGPDEINIATGWIRIGSNKLIVPEDNPYHALLEKKKLENNGKLPFVQRQNPMKTCRIFINGNEVENDGNVINNINPDDIISMDYDKAENLLHLKLKK